MRIPDANRQKLLSLPIWFEAYHDLICNTHIWNQFLRAVWSTWSAQLNPLSEMLRCYILLEGQYFLPCPSRHAHKDCWDCCQSKAEYKNPNWIVMMISKRELENISECSLNFWNVASQFPSSVQCEVTSSLIKGKVLNYISWVISRISALNIQSANLWCNMSLCLKLMIFTI